QWYTFARNRWYTFTGILIKIYADINIVLCDGSNFDFSLIVKNQFPNANIECLYFNNSSSLVSLYGKGYGEGEIVKYALDNSIILNKYNSFSKCTSKLWLVNYFEYVKAWSGHLFLCDCCIASYRKIFNIKPAFVDTRFYITNKSFYQKHLSLAYLNVRDADGYFLEHCFKDIIVTENIKRYISPVSLVLQGVSGSSGLSYNVVRKSKTKELSKKFILRINGLL
ncbi:MAG: hypothetical protein ACOYLR_06200, partial [Chlorobium sp.]